MNLDLFITKPLKTNCSLFEKINYYQWTFNFQAKWRQHAAFKSNQMARITYEWTKMARHGPFSMWFNSPNLFFPFPFSTFHIRIVYFCYLSIWKTRTGATIFRYHFIYINLSLRWYHIIKCGARVCLLKNRFGGVSEL